MDRIGWDRKDRTGEKGKGGMDGSEGSGEERNGKEMGK